MRTRRRKKLHWYRVILIVQDREDVGDDWNTTETIVFASWSIDRARNYMYHHRYLETEMDHMDDGTSWLHIQSLCLVKIR